jgi:hypothetical protein
MGTVFFQNRGMASVVWNPETSKPWAEFGKVGRFETDDPKTIEKLRELGYPEHPGTQPVTRYAQSAQAPKPAEPPFEVFEPASATNMDEEVPLDDAPVAEPEPPPSPAPKTRILQSKRARKVR